MFPFSNEPKKTELKGTIIMSNLKEFNERRKDPRYKAGAGLFALIDTDISTKMGQVVDISNGGVGFRYKEYTEQPAEDVNELVIIYDDDNSNNNVRFTFKINTVSEHEIPNESQFSSVRKKRCGVKFNDMSYYQKAWLNYLILNHTKGEI